MFTEILADPKVHAEIQTVLSGIIILLATIAGKVVVSLGQLIVAKTKAEHNALYGMIASRLVAYTEQTMANNSNIEKSSFVADTLRTKFPDLPEDEVHHILEEAVSNFKAQLVPNVTTATVADGTATASVTTIEKPKESKT